MTKIEYAELCLFLIALVKAIAKKQTTFKIVSLDRGEHTLSVEKAIKAVSEAGIMQTLNHIIESSKV